uniref:Uncharacterized protein n=1 Tax=Nothobranchius furzeri TaxID=105023 RepID=A0A8C6NWI5_NOTFU
TDAHRTECDSTPHPPPHLSKGGFQMPTETQSRAKGGGPGGRAKRYRGPDKEEAGTSRVRGPASGAEEVTTGSWGPASVAEEAAMTGSWGPASVAEEATMGSWGPASVAEEATTVSWGPASVAEEAVTTGSWGPASVAEEAVTTGSWGPASVAEEAVTTGSWGRPASETILGLESRFNVRFETWVETYFIHTSC